MHEGQLDRPNGLKVYKKVRLVLMHAAVDIRLTSLRESRMLVMKGRSSGATRNDTMETVTSSTMMTLMRRPMLMPQHVTHTVISSLKVRTQTLYRSCTTADVEFYFLELLAPLTAAADLPQHPSLSIPYLSDTLTSMTRQACSMLHREKRSLYAVKNLLTKFRGDDAFIPCGSLNSEFDQQIFDIKPVYGKFAAVKLHIHPPESLMVGPPDPQRLDGSSGLVSGASHDNTSDTVDRLALAGHERDGLKQSFANGDTKVEQEIAEIQRGEYTTSRAIDATMAENSSPKEDSARMATEGIETRDTAVGTDATVEEVVALNEEQEDRLNVSPLPLSSQQDAHARPPSTVAIGSNDVPDEEAATLRSPKDRALPSPESLKDEPSIENIDDRHDTLPTTAIGSTAEEIEAKATEEAEDKEVGDESQPVPRRMRTRAQAQAASDKSASHTRTPSPASWVPPVIHPLYLMPESARPGRDFGLPPDEAEDTRRLLMAFVQKQEEVVRGAEKLYEGLLRADRMRQTVFKWCKAEGHVGEMSDGEDWYDKEEWGLDEDLKKGQGDEEEDTTTQGKKSRKTRQHQ